jgi:hypothetical protein
VGAAASLCGPMMTHQRIRKSVGSLGSEELLRTSHLMVRCGPLYHRVPSFVSLPLCLNFEHFMIYVLCCKTRIHVMTHILDHVSDVLCVNTSVLATRKDPGWDWPSLLKGGTSQKQCLILGCIVRC